MLAAVIHEMQWGVLYAEQMEIIISHVMVFSPVRGGDARDAC